MAPFIDHERPLDQPPGKLHFPDDLRARIGSYGADFVTRISDQDLAGLDFSWMSALAQFDRWTALTAGRLRDHPVDFFFEPIPNFASVMVWVKLRYALGLRQGDLPLPPPRSATWPT